MVTLLTWSILRYNNLKGAKTIDFNDYQATIDRSIHNIDADKVMLGKYDGGGPTSYITKAGEDYTYFDLGADWDTIKEAQGLTDQEMFDLYNTSFLDDAMSASKPIHFSHNPIGDTGFLGQELQYIINPQNGYGYVFDEISMIAYPLWK
ncbi:MAG: hypothetical protein ACK5LC_10985 [Coprobacillaceae bacterium]